MKDYVGTWQMADASGSADMTVTTIAAPPQLKLVLPESMKLPGGREILLRSVSATTFRATDKSGGVVQFILKSQGHAELSMKGHSPGAWSYFDTDLTRQ